MLLQDIKKLRPEWVDILTNPESVQCKYRPVVVYAMENNGNIPDVPTNDKASFAYKWWKTQIHRCLNGWFADDGVYINGFLYFYLNFCTVEMLLPWSDAVEWDNPLFRDNDKEILDILWFNRFRITPDGRQISAKNHIEAKGRRIAWTTITTLGVALYMIVFKRGATIGFAYPDTKTMTKERGWFTKAFNALHPMFKRWDGYDTSVLYNNKEWAIIGYQVGKVNVEQSRFRFDVVGERAKALGVYKGEMMNLITVVEAGKWHGKNLTEFYAENIDSIAQGDQQGMMLIGGTSNAINNKSTDYKDMFFAPEEYNATTHFTSSTKVRRTSINYFTGESLQEDALEKIMADRKKVENNPARLAQKKMENPISTAECFIPDTEGIYDLPLVEQLIMDIKEKKTRSNWVRGRLEYVKDHTTGLPSKEVEFFEDHNGSWVIDPMCPVGKSNRYEDLYVAGIDDKYKNTTETKRVRKDASKNCMIVWAKPAYNPEFPSDKPAAMYFGDLKSMHHTYHEFRKGMLFYAIKSETLYEYNSEGFVEFLRGRNELHQLYHIGPHTPGLKVHGPEKNMLTYLGDEMFATGRIRNIDNVEMLESLKIWRTVENTDIASALHLVFFMLNVTAERMVKARKEAANSAANIIVRGGHNAGKKYSGANNHVSGTSKIIRQFKYK